MAIRSGDDGGGAHDTLPIVADRGGDVARRWWALVQAVANVAWPLAAYVTLVPYVGGTDLEEPARIVVGYAFLPLIFVGLMQIVSLSEVTVAVRHLLLRSNGTDAGPPGPLAWVGYLAALGMLTRHELRWMGRAAVVAP